MTPSTHRLRAAQPALLIVFLLTGHVAMSGVAWVPEYIERLNVSFATWGTILGVSVIGSVAPLLFASRIIMRWGSRPIIHAGIYLAMAFLVSLAWTTNPVVWTLLNTGFTFSMSLVGAGVNTHAVALQQFHTRPIVSRLHAGWSIGAVVAAVTGAVSTVITSLEVFLIVVAVITIVGFEILRPMLLSPQEDGHHADRASHVKRRFYQIPGQLWILSIGLVCAVYPEVAIVDWAALFAREALDAELALRAVPFAAFMVGMIIGRLSMTRLAETFHPHTVASRGSAVAAIALTLSLIVAPPTAQANALGGLIVASVLWLVVGLGLSGVAPTFFSAAAHIPNVSTAWALGRMQLINQLASIGAKALMGALAQGVSLTIAFGFPVILLLIGSFVAARAAQGAQTEDLDEVSTATGTLTLPVITPRED